MLTYKLYDTAGPDGIWLTGDDTVLIDGVWNYDVAGNVVQIYRDGLGAITEWSQLTASNGGLTLDGITYSDAGPDTVWQTADDTIGYITHQVSDAAGHNLIYASAGIGVDNIWFTVDDYLQYTAYTYDPQGVMTSQINYTGPGLDGVWFTADDQLNTASYPNVPWP